jgi:hypothetical protein
MLRTTLGIPIVLLGLALPDDRAHAPNERFHLPNLWQGIDTLVWFLLEAAELELPLVDRLSIPHLTVASLHQRDGDDGLPGTGGWPT